MWPRLTRELTASARPSGTNGFRGVAMAYPLGAVERAMKVRDVILQVLAGKLTWIQAAEILGRSARCMRRLRLKFERYGVEELYDRRRRTPFPSARQWPRCNAC
jgi:hypothetical protein